MWLVPALVDDMIVVSEIGEIWSPAIAPEIIEPINGKRIGILVAATAVVAFNRESSIGMAIGIMMAIVPQAEPVASEIMSEAAKNMRGMNFMLIEPTSKLARY